MRTFGIATAAAIFFVSAPAMADGDAGAESVSGCVESVPKGAQKPIVIESFPPRGTSGWAATLHVVVRHGKGERVLPNGLDLSAAQDAKKYLHDAGFSIPDQQGGAAAQVWSEEDKGGSSAVTHLVLPLVVLPAQPGRQSLVLPPLPVAVARANGEIATVCTHPHSILVEDPIASTPDPKPKSNPLPRPQREEWTALKKALLWGGLGVAIGAILAWFVYKQVTKPKPPPPPPPPRPPWDVALEKLDEVRHAGLLESQRHAEHFDRVSDAVRGYLGARFGFDGLESTTDEILASLKKHAGGFVRLDSGESEGPSPGIPLRDVEKFLFECDLVKFAKYVPTPEQCGTAIDRGEHIVRATMPFVSAPPPRTDKSEKNVGAP
ncbi:MAG TPA: hypothetical protein VIF62_25585 [Labilithrix sp.]|jgi:hypothetical protein